MDREKLYDAIENNMLFDFIANEYDDMTKYELKEVLLAVLGVCYDKCCGDEDEEALMELIRNELHDYREFY